MIATSGFLTALECNPTMRFRPGPCLPHSWFKRAIAEGRGKGRNGRGRRGKGKRGDRREEKQKQPPSISMCAPDFQSDLHYRHRLN